MISKGKTPLSRSEAHASTNVALLKTGGRFTALQRPYQTACQQMLSVMDEVLKRLNYPLV
jgi:hypothetical protein